MTDLKRFVRPTVGSAIFNKCVNRIFHRGIKATARHVGSLVVVAIVAILAPSIAHGATLYPEYNEPTLKAIKRIYGHVPGFIEFALKKYPLAILELNETADGRVDGRFYDGIGIGLKGEMFNGIAVRVEDPYVYGILAHESWHAYEYSPESGKTCIDMESTASYIGDLVRASAQVLRIKRRDPAAIQAYLDAYNGKRRHLSICQGEEIHIPSPHPSKARRLREMITQYIRRVERMGL